MLTIPIMGIGFILFENTHIYPCVEKEIRAKNQDEIFFKNTHKYPYFSQIVIARYEAISA
jgi:hypothetical protein